MDKKSTLSFRQTKTFLAYFLDGILNSGMIKPLESFINVDIDLTLSINSLFKNIVSGQSFQDSLKNMNKRFPFLIEKNLIQGFENSILDLKVENIISIIDKNNTDDYINKQLKDLITKNISNNPDIICEECFNEEFYKLIERVKNEKAYKVILAQENEEFFIQKYLGIKLVIYKEVSHSKIYQSFEKKIYNSEFIEVYEKRYEVSVISKKIFCIKSKEICFVIEFENG